MFTFVREKIFEELIHVSFFSIFAAFLKTEV